ncbi:MAG: Aldehyde ferredoxin oxidoreductase, partial [Deltaproteobacteria bacterium]|nr:Aldehyde ferredoxin oxidoreductase [Deltaproteobacteria bacterium]
MQIKGGWLGRTLKVDLENGTCTIVPTEGEQEFIGGRGINQYLLLRDVSPNLSPLSPESPLIFGVGPLVGSHAISSSRMSIEFKNVVTGGVGSANVGGLFPAELKSAGYDQIIVTGRSDKPVYLHIQDDSIDIRDAQHFWGKGTYETGRAIKKELGDPNVRIASIGPAGENRVAFACIIADEGRAAGLGGCGAVMGSKNLKAIAAHGSKGIKIAHPSFFEETLRKQRERIESSDRIKKLKQGGTHLTSGAGGSNHTRPQAARNLQDEFWPKYKSRQIREPAFKRYEVKRLACFNCQIPCGHLYEIPEGEYQGKRVEGMQANTVRAFSSNLDVTDPLILLTGNYLCNDLGLDVDGTGVALGWIYECFQRGVLGRQDTDGLNLNWGNGNDALAMVKKIAFRQGIGDLLASGVAVAAKELGRGSETWAMHVKGAPINESCMRTHIGWAFGVITSARGAGHLRGSPGTERQPIPSELSQRLWGIPNAADPSSYHGKAKLVCWFESFKAVVDCLGICYFTTQWTDPELLGPRDLADLLYGATGMRLDEDQILRFGEKIQNMEKAFNTIHAGFRREDDYPPERLTNSSVSRGLFKGMRLDDGEWNRMLDEYYRIHRWDEKTSWQTEGCLDDLGLPTFIKERLRDCG